MNAYGQYRDFAAFDAWYEDALNFARGVIPSHTVVGRAIGSTRVTPPKAIPVDSAGAPVPSGGEMPSWVVPVAIGAGVLLLFSMMKKGRR